MFLVAGGGAGAWLEQDMLRMSSSHLSIPKVWTCNWHSLVFCEISDIFHFSPLHLDIMTSIIAHLVAPELFYKKVKESRFSDVIQVRQRALTLNLCMYLKMVAMMAHVVQSHMSWKLAMEGPKKVGDLGWPKSGKWPSKWQPKMANSQLGQKIFFCWLVSHHLTLSLQQKKVGVSGWGHDNWQGRTIVMGHCPPSGPPPGAILAPLLIVVHHATYPIVRSKCHKHAVRVCSG